MTTLDAKAALVTQIQNTLRDARDTRDAAKLRAGADLMNSTSFEALPFDAQVDLSALYAEANLRVTGALM